jgi:hypothetical protein
MGRVCTRRPADYAGARQRSTENCRLLRSLITHPGLLANMPEKSLAPARKSQLVQGICAPFILANMVCVRRCK